MGPPVAQKQLQFGGMGGFHGGGGAAPAPSGLGGGFGGGFAAPGAAAAASGQASQVHVYRCPTHSGLHSFSLFREDPQLPLWCYSTQN